MIRPFEISDVKLVSKIHNKELSGFLTGLGLGFLKLFYKTSLLVPEMFTFVEVEDGVVKGFVTSITEARGLYKKIILKSPLSFIFIFLSYIITHPQSLIKFMQILTYPGFKEDGAELLSIAIDRQYHLKGIGKKLFLKTAEEFKKRGISSFKISVYNRLPANGFYKKIGCRLTSSFYFIGEKMNYYEYKI